MEKRRYAVSGMQCEHCEKRAEKALGALPGVRSVKANAAEGRVDIECETAVETARVAEALRAAGGYELTEEMAVGDGVCDEHEAENHHHHEQEGHAHGDKHKGHSHHHSHHHVVGKISAVLIGGIVLNLLYTGVEAGVGWWKGSLGLLSDAGHNLSDVFALTLSLVAVGLGKIKASKRYTYGYKKSTVLISLLNAIILLVAVGAIVAESLRKLRHPEAIDGAAVSWTAGVGILVNGLTAFMLMRGSKGDLNIRGAFLHMVADTLVSVGVVVSGIILVLRPGWGIIDPIVSLVIAAVILVSTWKLLAESLRESMDAVPETIDPENIETLLAQQTGVKAVHHLHIWPISTDKVAMTAHVVVEDIGQMGKIKTALRKRLAEQGIGHATLEVETEGECCHCSECE